VKGLRSILLWLAAVLWCAPAAYSQAVNATLVSNVTDITGAVGPNAEVAITEASNGVTHTGQTNESGNYSFPDLPPGTYNVSVEATGSNQETCRHTHVPLNTTMRTNSQLIPGALTETVEVTSAAPIVQTGNAAMWRRIDRTVVGDSPLRRSNRNFRYLPNLVSFRTANLPLDR
jgi:hypothetical protein